MVFSFLKRRTKHDDPSRAVAAGDYETALEIYRQRARNDATRAATWHKKAAEVLALLGRTGEAVEEYLAAAAAYERDERHLQALALYRTVLRLDPDNDAVREKLGEIAAPEPAEGEAQALAQGMTIRTRLKKYVPLFSEFDREELTGIVEVMEVRRFETGQVVFSQGEPGDSLWIVAEGEVALTVQGNDGEPVEVERIAEGGFFGEVSALSRAPRNVTAVTTRPSELLELTRDYLEAVAIVHPRVWEVLEEFQKRRQVPVGV